jgi:DNA helicase-2/ATP-dependent DNA helicase PcrA
MKRVNRAYTPAPASGPSRRTSHASPVTLHLSPVTPSPWKVGQNVVHPTFGSGVIVNAEGRGADARVQVNFKKSGLKWLMLEYAKLAAA